MQAAVSRTLSRWLPRVALRIMLVVLLGLGAHTAGAMEVAVLLSEPEGRGQRFVDALDAALAPGIHRLASAGLADGDIDAALLGRADVVLAVGQSAAKRALQESSRPVLAVLVGLRDVERLRA